MPRFLDEMPRRLRIAVLYSLAFLVFAAAGFVLIQVLALVTPLVLAVAATLLLAALLMPLVEALRRLRVPRALAALIAVILLIAVVGLIGTFFAMSVAREVGDLRTDAAGGIEALRAWLVNGPLGLGQEQVDRISAQLTEQLRAIVNRLLRGFTTVLEVVGMVLLSVVLLFFLLRDGPRMSGWVIGGLPERHRDRVGEAARSGWRTLQSFVRGTALIAAVDAIGIGVGLFILGVPLALPLALVTFIAAFVPLVGATIAGALAVVVALVTEGPITALLVLGVVLLVQNLEGSLLEPVIMGRAVRLHPAVILLAVAAGALAGGIGGALLATPITAMTYRIVHTLRTYTGRTPAPAPRQPVAEVRAE